MTKSLFGLRSAALGLAVAAVAAAPAGADSLASPARAHMTVPAAHADSTAPYADSTAATPPAPSTVDRGEGQRSVAPVQPHRRGSAGSGVPSVDTSQCAQTPFSQPFKPFGDFGYYTLMPGQNVDDFAGTGWTLTGGASIVQAKLRDGSTGSVLNLPGGSSAVSPFMCVGSNYPTGRTMIRDVKGFSGVQFYVSYEGTRTWLRPRNTGLVHGNSTAWTLSHSFSLQPNRRTVGWQIVRFRLSAGLHSGIYQLYNVYVDPHMHL